MSNADPLIDRVFDRRYVIKRKLGSGGMADVYLAEDQELGRNVALKLLNERHAADEQFVERFRREAQSAAGLNHPNIVSIFDRGYAEGTYYIAMEYLEGRTLKELLVRNGPTPIPVSIEYARQILGALAFAHRNGIVHRDIKPHNIVVGSDGRLKVTDFGIARSGASQMTEAGSIVGTAQYLSPEQARGAAVDPRSDLYSLGIVLYEMLTGHVPFTGDTPVEIAMKHLSLAPEPPSALRPDVPHNLDAVVMRALAKDPDQRYGSAEEMDAELARVARGLAVSRETEEAMTQVIAGTGGETAHTMVQRPRALTPAPPAYRPPAPYEYKETAKKRSLWPWIIAAVVILAAAGGGYFLYERVQDQLNSNKVIAVPDEGLVLRRLAVDKIREAGLTTSVTFQTSETVPFGQVISQDPHGGSKVARGTTVALVVSKGFPMVVIPDVRKQSSTDAVSALSLAGLKYRLYNVYSPQPAGVVIGESPTPNTKVKKGSTVRINVSKGLKPVALPDVTTELFPDAEGTLKGLGFKVARTNVQDAAAKNTVISESPQGGTQQPVGSTITLTVSSGPGTIQVPDVTTDTEAAANSILSANFVVATITAPVTDPTQDGHVISQTPQGGTTAKPGSLVTITVGQFSQTTTDGTTTAPTP
jgi:beta-lactam-binding protein with PASTA domain/predicted Ser/Thr protein kinase